MRKFSVLLVGVIVLGSIIGLGLSGIPWVSAHIKDHGENGKVQETSRPGEMIIGFKAGITDDAVNAFYDEYYAGYGLKKKEDLDRQKKRHGRQQKLAEAPEAVARDLMALLRTDLRVEYVEPNYLYATQVIPNDVRFAELWGLHNSGQTGGTVNVDIDAPAAWDIPVGTQDVLVAVIDTGVDFTHEDLAGNMWVNPNEIPGNGIDDDGNGYVDDIHGINAITNSGNPFDDNGHGTHVAGTIAAVRGNSVGVSGVSHNVKIIACKFLNSAGSGTAANATECLKYVNHLKHVLGQNIVMTNNSWGGSAAGSQAIQDALAGLDQPGMNPILHVTAAGNSNRDNEAFPFFPASFTLNNVLAVAATDHNDLYATFSNFGLNSVDVAAPGVTILSTVPNEACQLCDPTGYRLLDGTSMASPHVAGIAALVWGTEPTLTAEAVKQRLLSSVDPLTDSSKRTATDGRVNARQALTNGGGPVAPAIISTPGLVANVGQAYTYQAQASGSSPISWSMITGPVGMTINPSSGLVSWPPSTSGNFFVTLEARNAVGSDTQSFSITVVEPAAITSTPVLVGVVGQLYTYQASATGTQPITWSLVSGPAGMTMAGSTGLVSWVPDGAGSVNVQIQASNLGGADTQTYTIEVLSPPTITSPPVTEGVVGQLYQYQPLVAGTLPLTWELLQSPLGMTIDSATGRVTWTPLTVGSFPVQLQVSNAVGSDTQSFSITVGGLIPPTINSTPGTGGNVGQAYSYQATATGTQPITWSRVSGPAGMTVGVSTGLVSWVPGAAGSFPVQLQASNVAGTHMQTFTITVTVFPPTVTSFAASPNPILVGRTATLTWATIGADTVSIDNGVGVGLPPTGSVQVNPTTTTTYTLTAGGAGGTRSAVLTVIVNLPASEAIALTRMEFRPDKTEWRIEGTSSVPGPGNSITIHVGPTVSGPILGIATINNVGAWEIRIKNATLEPDGTQTISVESTRGGILEGVPLVVK